MSEGIWVDIAPAGDVPPGEHRTYVANGWYMVVYHVQGALYALEDRCTHDDNPIEEGVVEGLEVICPRHGARFCLKSGAAMTPPAYEPVKTFAVAESGGRLRVCVD
ncbi:MAG: non-heme iron oxygenase ferredoxin subunit [Pseudomonadota bacterium]